jgi:outer membrane murein-binding lipoprotein Lpp
MTISRAGRILPIVALLAATLALSACGSGNDKAVKQLQQQGADLRQDGANLQLFVKQEAADVKAGKKTQAQADKEIQAKTAVIEKKASAAAHTAIDAAKSQNGLSKDAKKQLDDAQKQIDAATNGQ